MSNEEISTLHLRDLNPSMMVENSNPRMEKTFPMEMENSDPAAMKHFLTENRIPQVARKDANTARAMESSNHPKEEINPLMERKYTANKMGNRHFPQENVYREMTKEDKKFPGNSLLFAKEIPKVPNGSDVLNNVYKLMEKMSNDIKEDVHRTLLNVIVEWDKVMKNINELSDKNELQKRIEVQQRELESLHQQIKVLYQQSKEQQHHIEHVRVLQQQNEVQQQNEKQHQEIRVLETRNEILQQHNEEQELRLEGIQKRNELLEELDEKQQWQIGALQQQKEELLQQNEKQQQQIRGLQEQNKALQQQSGERQQQIRELREDNIMLQQQSEEQQQELRALQEHNKVHSRGQQQQLRTLQEENIALQQQSEEQQQQFRALQEENKALQQQNVEQQPHIRALQYQNKALQQQSDEQQQQLRALQEENKTLQEQSEEQQQELRALQEQNTAHSREQQQQLTALQEQNEVLQQQREEQQQQLIALQEQIDRMQKNIGTLQEQNEILNRWIGALKLNLAEERERGSWNPAYQTRNQPVVADSYYMDQASTPIENRTPRKDDRTDEPSGRNVVGNPIEVSTPMENRPTAKRPTAWSLSSDRDPSAVHDMTGQGSWSPEYPDYQTRNQPPVADSHYIDQASTPVENRTPRKDDRTDESSGRNFVGNPIEASTPMENRPTAKRPTARSLSNDRDPSVVRHMTGQGSWNPEYQTRNQPPVADSYYMDQASTPVQNRTSRRDDRTDELSGRNAVGNPIGASTPMENRPAAKKPTARSRSNDRDPSVVRHMTDQGSWNPEYRTRNQPPVADSYYIDQDPIASSTPVTRTLRKDDRTDEPSGRNAIGNPTRESTPKENRPTAKRPTARSLSNDRDPSVVPHMTGQDAPLSERIKTVLQTTDGKMQDTLYERFVGEIASQLDKRIIDLILQPHEDEETKKRRFCGNGVQDIESLILKEAVKSDGTRDLRKESGYRKRLDKLLKILSKEGYIRDKHARFSREIIKKYGLLSKSNFRDSLENTTLGDLDFLRELLYKTTDSKAEFSDCMVLLNSLCAVQAVDKRPLFVLDG